MRSLRWNPWGASGMTPEWAGLGAHGGARRGPPSRVPRSPAGGARPREGGGEGAAGGEKRGGARRSTAERSTAEDIAGEDTAEPDGAKAEDGAEGGEAAGQAADDDATPLDADVTIVPGVARYHRRGCILIRFLSDGDLEARTRREAEATGLVPCKACQPDKPDPSAGPC